MPARGATMGVGGTRGGRIVDMEDCAVRMRGTCRAGLDRRAPVHDDPCRKIPTPNLHEALATRNDGGDVFFRSPGHTVKVTHDE